MAERPAKIVFLDRGTLSPSTVLGKFDFPHELTVHERTDPSETASRVAGADIIITNKVRVGAAELDAAPDARLIAVAATGTDVVDLDACAARDVKVSNIRNYAVNTVPEHTFALIFALRRSIAAYDRSVAAGRWREARQFCYFDYPIRDLAGSTLGILGDGVLGQAVANIGRALGMKVLFSSYKGVKGMGPLYTDFHEVLRRSDIVTLHCPLMPSTRGMIGKDEFAIMERHPLLINTARGGLVDEPALADALEQGQIGGAGFDVVTQEPMPEGHPFERLLGRPDFLLTPHVAWASDEAIQSLADQLVENVNLFWRGEGRNFVSK